MGSIARGGGSFENDEEIYFFPTLGHLNHKHDAWHIFIHGWIFKPENNSRRRKALLALLRKTAHLQKGDEENQFLLQRARPFLVTNQKNKGISVRIENEEFILNPSKSNGHFQDWITIPAAQLQTKTEVSFQSGSSENSHVSHGNVQLLQEQGLSIISDVDDTIKITEVGNRRAVLRNTFLHAYQDVPGTAEIYRSWAKKGVSFHYISGTPWQLAPTLLEFLRSRRFPFGSLHLRSFRWKDRSVFGLFRSPKTYKPPLIKNLLEIFPKRQFILIGDSGEKDPEIYGELRRQYSGQIIQVFIRDLFQAAKSARFQKAFRGIPRSAWSIFHDPSELRFFSINIDIMNKRLKQRP